MGLIGDCSDCGEPANLRYKPHVPHDKQTRPSICDRCKERRERMARESHPDAHR